MSRLARRQFLQSMAAVAAFPAIITANKKAKQLPIAFSTLGCPKWDWKTILNHASQHGYAALELRGLLNEMDLPKSPQFTGAKLKESLKDLSALGLKISDLGASARLGEADPQKRIVQLDEARRFVDLAHKLNAPYVRVFGGKLEAGQSKDEAIKRISAGFRELHDHAKGSGVALIIESHDEFTDSPSLLKILQGANVSTAALLWDAHHTFAAANESPAETYKQVGSYTRHTHLKDSRPGAKGREYVLTGEGDVPVRETVKVLAANNYRGYYCYEWEKRWHPELPEPEVAFPHFAKVIRGYLAEAGIKA
ncbi:MAG TPA: sugar phosphate isomerase/epimerase family protein [Blastocatellia bacterium]|nr:sugar phosphate isomerase/epimerase family protein [Blastocatellia bacterium]